MDPAQLLPLLQGCLSHDSNHVKEAGAMLKQLEPNPGYGIAMLRAAAEAQLDAGVRQVAAINFKNYVKRSWEAVEARFQEQAQQQFVIADADKQVIRDNLLEALLRAPNQVKVQLGEVFKTVVYADYPQAWPNLLQDMYACLASQDQSRVHGGLYAMRILTRKYEFRDDEEREPLKAIVETTFPLLLHIFQTLLNAPSQDAQVCEYIKLICKTFWSATYMGMPEQFSQQNMFLQWMSALGNALTKPQPPEVAALPVDERAAAPWWKTKKWILHITYRIFNRYAQPKHTRGEMDQMFSKLYSETVMVHFMEAHLSLVAELAKGTYFSPRAINLLLQYLQHAVGIPATYKLMRPHWDNILHNVAFPLMCFSDVDAQLWAEDPQEYIRKGYDILEDMYSPKTAAANFAHELCEKKKVHLDAFMAMLARVMGEFQAAGPAPSPLLARRMDGALLAVGCMVHILKAKKPYKEQLGGMMATAVMPCFASPYGHLRSKAVWVAGVFCGITFPDGQGQGGTFLTFLQQVVRCLGDSELPVRVDSVVALRHFLEEAEDTAPIAPMLPALLTSIFGLMDQVDNEDLVFTLEALVEKFSEEIAPYALDMARQLAAAFARYSAQMEDENDDDEGAGIAAFGCMRALNTLLESVASRPEVFVALEEILCPLMHTMISTNGQDIFEEVVEMLSYFTYYAPTISDRLWALWPQLQSCLMDWALDYWDNILVPLDNFVSRGKERFLTSTTPDYQASVYAMVRHSLAGDLEAEERSIVPAAKLMEAVLQNCRGAVDKWVAPYLALATGKLATATNRTLRDTLMLVVADCLYYNAPLALGVLAQAGQTLSLFTTWFGMIFANKKSGKPKHFRRQHDKKVCVLGLTALLACPEEALPAEVAAGMPQVVAGIMRLLQALKVQQEEEAALGSEEEDDEEGEDGDDDEEDDDSELGEEDLAKLRKQAKDLLEGDGDDDDGSDDEFTDDEEYQTPIDDVDPFVLFAEQLSGLQGRAGPRYVAIMQALAAQAAAGGQDPTATEAALAALFAHAEKLKAEALEAAARRAQ